MIDTDKYEGHTPGPWWIDKVSDNGETNTWLMGNAPQDDMLFCIEFAEGNDADVRLIAAAPDLLAEVKRLREENDALLSAIDMCIVTQMNSVEHGFRYQSGGCFEHYSYWQHEKESEEE